MTRLKNLRVNSDRMIAQVIWNSVFTARNAILYRIVFRVTDHALPLWKK